MGWGGGGGGGGTVSPRHKATLVICLSVNVCVTYDSGGNAYMIYSTTGTNGQQMVFYLSKSGSFDSETAV